jgi:hypothetical protein
MNLPVEGRGKSEYSIQLERIPGTPIATVGPAYRLVANMRGPHLLRFRLRSTYGVMSRAELPLDEAPLPDWESGLWHLDLLEELQKFTNTPLVFPVSEEEWQSVRRAVALLRGETYTQEEHWTGSAEGSEDDLPAVQALVDSGDAFGRTEPLTVVNGGHELLVGICRLAFAGARISGIAPVVDGRIRVLLEGGTVIESGRPLPDNEPAESQTEADTQLESGASADQAVTETGN